MSTSDQAVAIKRPGPTQAVLCVLLLALFSPVVLAVGAAAFRPPWLAATVAGVPLSMIWILASIATFVVLTWLIALMAFTRSAGAPDEEVR